MTTTTWRISTLAASLVLGMPAVIVAAPASPPNIVFILADDVGYGELGCYGQREIQTPHLDRMAAEGVRFTQFYAGASICAPSRSVLMTGLHNGHGRVRDNLPHGVHLTEEDLTVAEVLRRQGYRTGQMGKWSLGQHDDAGAPWRQGFEVFFGYIDQDHAHRYYTDFLWDNDHRITLSGNRDDRREVYVPHLLLDRALAFLDRAKEDRRPFFLYFPTNLSHNSEHPKNSPDAFIVPSDLPYTDRDWPQVEKNYAAMVTLIDEQVGRILDRLQVLGLERNTLVIFASDNGAYENSIHQPEFFHGSGPLRGYKRTLYEGGIRVPTIARWPGVIAPGRVDATVAGFVDILPTFAELAGAPVPAGLDGISFAPVLRAEPRAREHEFLYWDYGHTRARFEQAVRAGDWKAVRNGRGAPLELYNLANDIGESRNVAAAHPEVTARLARLMDQAYVPSPDYPPPVERSPGNVRELQQQGLR